LRADAAEDGHMRYLLVLILPVLFAGHAATASNTVAAAPAGSGAGSVSGYTISSVSYSLAGDSVSGVSFALSPASAAMVKVRLAPGEPWTSCTVAGGAASCPVAIVAADAVSLEIIAAA
jgi:hypothetical protein